MSALTSLTSTVKLNDGVDMPCFGLGVYEMDDGETFEAVTWALEAGYRLVDSAAWYYNEAACKKAIEAFCKKTSTPRESVFYTTKLREPTTYDRAVKAIDASLAKAPNGIIDLYLMHSAIGGPRLREESWRAMEAAKKQGKIRSIGVSNWGVKHLEEHVERCADSSRPDCITMPSVNQIDLHPFMSRKEIVSICQTNGIHLEAWAPLVRGLKMKDPVVQRVARAHDVSPAQVLIRWGLQQGYTVIPKSSSQSRIEENANVFSFELSVAEMGELSALDEYLVTDWDVVDTP